MTEREKMLAGLLYDGGDEELCRLRKEARNLCQSYNAMAMDDRQARMDAIKKLFGSTGKSVTVMPTFFCDYGKNIHVGENFFMNYDCVILDVCEVKIGDNCLVAPQVGIYTAYHPLNVGERISGKEYGAPVTIGNNCWIGGRAVINPGVTLGDNVVVASGAVVTKSFPSNVMIGGVPAKIIKYLEPNDGTGKPQVEKL